MHPFLDRSFAPRAPAWRCARILLLTLLALCGLAPRAQAAKFAWTSCTSTIHCSNPSYPVAGGGSARNRYQHPELVPIFWEDCRNCNGAGLQFTNRSTTPTDSQFLGMLMEAVHGAWPAALTQYGTLGGATGSISRARVAPVAPIFTGYAPGTTHTTATATKADVTAVIDSLIAAGKVPAPYAGEVDTVTYVVFTPTSAVSYCGANGCNDYIPGGYAGTTDFVQIEVNSANPGVALTHEVAEAISNWQGIAITNCSDGTNGVFQIADVCNLCSETQDGTAVTAYWSAADQACVVPEAFGSLEVNANDGGGWWVPWGAFPMRQAYGGGGGLVATDTNGKAYFYSQSDRRWLGHKTGMSCFPCWQADSIGISGAELAAGGTGSGAIVARLPRETASGIGTYTLSQGPNMYWDAIGSPNGALATSVNVTSAGTVVVTDRAGNLWTWSGTAWVDVGQPPGNVGVDQVVASGANVLVLDRARAHVFELNPAARTWTTLMTTRGPAAQIIGTPDAPDWGVVLAGSAGLETDASGTPGPALDFAVSGAPQTTYTALGNLGYAFDVLWCDGATGCAGGSGAGAWAETNLGAGRIVSGIEMFASGCGSAGPPCVSY